MNRLLALLLSLLAACAQADTPRWLQPLAQGDPVDAPQPPLPAWTPLPGAAALHFPVDPERAAHPRFDREVLVSREAFARLPARLASDPEAARYWTVLEGLARNLLAQGHTDTPPEKKETYIYQFTGQLPGLAFLYAASGQPDLGRLVRLLTLDAARRPMPFWIHAELRHYDPLRPEGGIETGDMARAVALALAWAPDAFSDAERAEVAAALRTKGVDPCLRWLANTTLTSNFLAVTGSGALLGALALGDDAAKAASVAALERWAALVEDDGSYGEPEGYFQFALYHFFTAWWGLGYAEGKERLQKSPLRGSLEYIAFHYVMHHDAASGETAPWKVNFGDDDYAMKPEGFVYASLGYAYGQGLGTWMARHLVGSDARITLYDLLFRLAVPDAEMPPPVSPEEAGLPLARAFDNGLAFFRSGWTFDHDLLFCLRSGGANRTQYVHDGPNRNSFALFADGEYLIAAPGRASYRSPIRKVWDLRTLAHNTVTLDGGDQTATRVAEVTAFSDADGVASLASEAAGAYPGAPKSVLRRVWYLRDRGWFAVEDTVDLASPAAVGWQLLLANQDGKSTVAPLGDGGWSLQRASASLALWIHADRPSRLAEAPGIMHTGYSYFPGDAKEGKPGSAAQLQLRTEKPEKLLHVWTLIVPRAQAAPGLAARFASGPDGDDSASWIVSRDGAAPEELDLRSGGAPRIGPVR